MSIRFQRLLARAEALEPGQYTVETPTGEPTLKCPACGAVYDLPLKRHDFDGERKHAADPTGSVFPAVRCPTPTCPFLDWVHLEALHEEIAD